MARSHSSLGKVLVWPHRATTFLHADQRTWGEGYVVAYSVYSSLGWGSTIQVVHPHLGEAEAKLGRCTVEAPAAIHGEANPPALKPGSLPPFVYKFYFKFPSSRLRGSWQVPHVSTVGNQGSSHVTPLFHHLIHSPSLPNIKH
jgi:hypothetical protein